jgi:hypothetical protein
MITDKVLTAIEATLDTTLDSHIVPEDEAFPTTGHTFIQVVGNNTKISYNENTVNFVINFSIVCSIRTRQYPTQRKRTPYLDLIDLQERTFFTLAFDKDLITALRTISDRASIVERFKSSNINTRVVTVGPTFFGSDDKSINPRNEAGYKLEQYYTSPTITIPIRCLNLPSDLVV